MNERIMERIFKALANRRRLIVLTFLRKHKKASVGEIAENLKLSFRSTSKHLNILADIGIVEKEQLDKYVFYKLSDDFSKNIRLILSQL